MFDAKKCIEGVARRICCANGCAADRDDAGDECTAVAQNYFRAKASVLETLRQLEDAADGDSLYFMKEARRQVEALDG